MINFSAFLLLCYWIVKDFRFYSNFRFYAIEVLGVLIFTLCQIALRPTTAFKIHSRNIL